MTKFCEDCTMRCDARGELVGGMSGKVEYAKKPVFGIVATINLGRLGVLYDQEGNASSLFNFPDDYQDADVARGAFLLIDKCPGALTARRGTLRKREVAIGCGALAEAALVGYKPWEQQLAQRIRPMLQEQVRQLLQETSQPTE